MGDAMNDETESVEKSGLERRQFIQRAGVGAAVAGGAWAAPSIIGTSVAFAAGSGDLDPDVDPPDPPPVTDQCGTLTWTATANNPGANGTGHLVPFPKTTSNPAVTLNSVTQTLVGGASAPSLNNPAVAAGANFAYQYRNLGVNQRAFQGQGSITSNNPGPPSVGRVGLVFVQNNQNGGNTSFASITNYREVTFTFNTVIQNLKFTIHDLSANTIDGNNTGVDSVGPAWAPSYWQPGTGGPYRDVIGFSRAITVTPGVGGAAFVSNSVNLMGSGTFSNPLRRTTNTSYWNGVSVNHMDVGITMPGPLSSFKMRYATVGGWGTQWISISNMTFGLC